MSEVEVRKVIAGNWMRKAGEAFTAAQVAFEHGLLVSCVNRLYYAAFYAVSAALAMEGREYGKHTAVRAAMHREYVKTRRVPVEYGELFDELFEDRQAGDYTPETNFTSEDIARLLADTRKLVDYFAGFSAKHE